PCCGHNRTILSFPTRRSSDLRALCSHPATARQSSSKRPNWTEAAMLEQLEQRINEVGALQTKLVLLIGRPGSCKSALIGALAKQDRKSTRLNSSHVKISYAVF